MKIENNSPLEVFARSQVQDIFITNEDLQDKHRLFKPLNRYVLNDIRNEKPEDDLVKHNSAEDLIMCESVSPDKCFCLIKRPVVGKFGAYYKGFETTTWKKLTFKIYKPAIFSDGGSGLEKQILSLSMRPYSIPQLFASFKFQQQNCLVLESLNTVSLKDKLLYCRRFPPDVVLFFMTEIVLAVSFLHSKGIIHRNVNLDAFWIQADGHLKLTDYTRCILGRSLWTSFAMTFGALNYAPPEVFRHRIYTKDTDTWAMGIILYRMTSGRLPFYSDSKKSLIRSIQAGKLTFNELFDEETVDLCANLLQKDYTLRIGHAKNTFLSLSNHLFFKDVQWDDVLEGKSKPPPLPLLVAAIRDDGEARHLNLRFNAAEQAKMKKKPLKLQTSSNGSIIFNLETRDKLRTFAVSKDLLKAVNKAKRTIADSSRRGGSGMKSSRVGSEMTKDDSPLLFLFFRIRLEEMFTSALSSLEANLKHGVHSDVALNEFQEQLNAGINEMFATLRRSQEKDNTTETDATSSKRKSL